MVRSLPRSAALALLFGVAGCPMQPSLETGDMSSAPMSPEDVLSQLQKETGFAWSARFHEDVHTPAFLEGRTAPLAVTARDAERASKDFLDRYRGLYSMVSAPDELSSVGSESDELGMSHARFQQRKGKIPVWGGELSVHFDSTGSLVRINGRYIPFSATTFTPARQADEARVLAANAAQLLAPDVALAAISTRSPALWHYPVSPSEARLAWRVEVEVSDDERPLLLETFIDAADGSVLHQSDLLAYVEGSGVGVFGDKQPLSIASRSSAYWLEDPSRGMPAQKTYTAQGHQRLPGGEEKSVDPNRWDEAGPFAGAAVDAHAYVATAWDYFLKVHGREGWDNKGTGVHASVHFGTNYSNAFFNGNQLVFGDGDPQLMAPTAGALDVVAHEFTHGVTAATARLGMEGQPGALNEALSDIFACFITHRAGQTDWQVGETIFHPNGIPRAIRDVAHPKATNNPSSMAEYADTTDDNGGVHLNSTIVSHAAYLMAEGGRGDGGSVVPAIGIDAAQKIWYRALTHYLTSRASFADAADATISAAHDLGMLADKVKQAWTAVGIDR